MDASLSLKPLRIKFPTSWAGHIPFAFWIVDKLRPECLVELGTHTGNSYFAFCQSVHATNLPTRCFAVDTWQGDEHAGLYGEDVFADVSQYNADHYASFSTLMRMTFDDAVVYFGEKSIDLLHIDGLHTYDAVKHDFETWLPKVSERGVVLFHDINVKERDFGVWRLWEEVSAGYPHIAFDHSHGLGVLFVGTDINPELLALLEEYTSENGRYKIKFLFSRLGASAEMQYQFIEAKKTQELLQGENARLEQERAALREESERVKKAQELLQGENARLEQERGVLREESERLKKTQELLQGENARLEQDSSSLQHRLEEIQSRLGRMERSSSWRMTKPVRKWTKSVRKRSRKIRHVFSGRSKGVANDKSYKHWIKLYDTLNEEKRSAIRTEIKAMKDPPLISIVMPVYNPPLEFLKEAIESVRNQLYPNWELCIADDKSPNNAVRKLLRSYAKTDSRIQCVFRETNGHISRASNSALELAKGDYIALLDHDDQLHPAALYYVAKEIVAYPSAGIVYSDEDKINEDGERTDPYFKSDFNYDLFLCQNMISHLGVYKRSLVKQIGGFRVNLEGSQDYDLALRVLELLDHGQVRHIPKVLYHWRIHKNSTASSTEAKPYVRNAALKAINEHLKRQGLEAEVVMAPSVPCHQKVNYSLLEADALVDIIILTRDKADLLKRCIDSLLVKTLYPHYQITIVDNGSVESSTLNLLNKYARNPRIKIIKDEGEFNYSRLNNSAVFSSNGEYVCLLNNDVEVISPEWLSEMLSNAARLDVGAVGARLLYPDDTVQHGGVVLGIGGLAGHAHKYMVKQSAGYFGRGILQQSFSAVTGACMLVKRELYLAAGGLNDVELKVAYNDVDFCLKLNKMGYRTIWTPYAELYHHESATRGDDLGVQQNNRLQMEQAYMRSTWGAIIENDPAYNPNLTLDREDFSLAWPPRVD